MHPIGIALAGAHIGQIGVPYQIATFGQANTGSFMVTMPVIEQTQVNIGGMLGEESKVHTLAIPGSAKWMGPTGPGLHFRHKHLRLFFSIVALRQVCLSV
jgi:hypothetical protein